jgi:hypothetical protein
LRLEQSTAFSWVTRPFPEHLAEKIRALPWMTEADLERVKEHSARDAATLAETGESRLS